MNGQIEQAIKEHFEQGMEGAGEMDKIHAWCESEKIRPLIESVITLAAAQTAQRLAGAWEPLEAKSVEELNALVPAWLMGVEAAYQHVADMTRMP